MQSSYMNIRDGTIYSEIDGSGEPLVFLHGYALDNRIWDDQFAYFARYYKVVKYDLRGFGKSSIPTEQKYSHHNDLRELLGYWGINHTNIIGLSMGGKVAIDFCLTYPGLINKLILVDSDVGGLKKITGSRFYPTVEIGRQKWLEDPLIVTALENKQISSKLRIIIDEYSGWHWVNKDTSRVDIAPPAVDRLHEIKSPSFVISGENDVDYFKDAAKLLSQKITNAQSCVIKNAGHLVSMEAPLELCTAIDKFLKE